MGTRYTPSLAWYVSIPHDYPLISFFFALCFHQSPPEGFVCSRSGTGGLRITWQNPTAPFPDVPLRVFANDSTGAPTLRDVSVVLCQCGNGGNCTVDTSTLDTATFDSNGYYQWPCRCPSFFSGASCEVDERGCGSFSTCPDYSVCVNDSSQASGYTCTDCQVGYDISMDGKCAGKKGKKN